MALATREGFYSQRVHYFEVIVEHLGETTTEEGYKVQSIIGVSTLLVVVLRIIITIMNGYNSIIPL